MARGSRRFHRPAFRTSPGRPGDRGVPRRDRVRCRQASRRSVFRCLAGHAPAVQRREPCARRSARRSRAVASCSRRRVRYQRTCAPRDARRDGASKVVHVAWGAARADSVRQALRLQGRAERVIALTPRPRRRAHRTVRPRGAPDLVRENTRPDDDPEGEPTDPEAPWAEATDPGVHPVYWACLTDAAGARMLPAVSPHAWPGAPSTSSRWARTSDDRVPPHRYGRWPVAPRADGRGRSRGQEKAAHRRRERLGRGRWTKLRQENAPLRIVRDGTLVSAPT